MLRIRRFDHLVRQLGVTRDRISEIADSHDECCREFLLIDPSRPTKERQVLHVTGSLRMLQNRLYSKILLRRLIPSPHSYGGTRGRHIKHNAMAHAKSSFAFTADISDFYPTISHKRVYNLFHNRFDCSPDVARMCTKICTFKYHLALGLVTSPLLADQVLSVIDKRIAEACNTAGIVYTRFVDDITLSADFDLRSSGFANLIPRILAEHGFNTNEKTEFGRLADGLPITKLRVKRGKLDVRAQYVEELERQLSDAARLAAGHKLEGPYYTEGQIRGRIEFVCWINPGRRRQLMARFKKIPWARVRQEAERRGLIVLKKELVPLPSG